MIDWLTLRLPADLVPTAVTDDLYSVLDRLVMVDGSSGELLWDRPCRHTVRSDSHQVTIECVGDLLIYGSPARVGQGNNVFGSDDIRECASRMLGFVADHLGVTLPDLENWRCTRCDVTFNYFLASAAEVRQALQYLSLSEGGRYQISTRDETIYWSIRSAFRSGKAYGKGSHLRYQVQRGKAVATADELLLADRLIRLELALRRHFFSRTLDRPWYQLSPADLATEHENYFSKLIGKIEVAEMNGVEHSIQSAAEVIGLTQGAATAAYSWWLLCKEQGHAAAKERTSKATYYRHMKLLRAAGIGYADLKSGRVIPLRRRAIVLDQPVHSWRELRAAA